MLHRVEVNIFDVCKKIAFIADAVLPESPLPNAPLAPVRPA
jgi:hypothetical protein